MTDLKQLITEMHREEWAGDFSVTYAKDDVVFVEALASAGDAIPTGELVGFMDAAGLRLGYVVPDQRQFQFEEEAP